MRRSTPLFAVIVVSALSSACSVATTTVRLIEANRNPGPGDPNLASPARDPSTGSDVLLALEREGCASGCPAYSLVVNTDGRVTYEGRSSVAVTGLRTVHLSDAELATIRQMFDAAHFFDLHGPFGCNDVTYPVASLTYNLGGQHKQLQNRVGCPGDEVGRLVQLEDQVDELTHSAQWVKAAASK